MPTCMPAIFLGHGNPMNAITNNRYALAWQALAAKIPKPKAIICVSAHWYIPATMVTATQTLETIHDFGGFPEKLSNYEYPAQGSVQLAKDVQKLLGLKECGLDKRRGLDHGAWAVLCRMYPKADIPVIQLSINKREPPEYHYALGKKLMVLRDEGVLFVGSGNVVHNLHAYAWGERKALAFEWGVRFESRVRELFLSRQERKLIAYETLDPEAMLSVPTPDHYLPLLYIAGMRKKDEAVTFSLEGFDGGSISMLTVELGV